MEPVLVWGNSYMLASDDLSLGTLPGPRPPRAAWSGVHLRGGPGGPAPLPLGPEKHYIFRVSVESASEKNGVFTRAHRCTGHRLSRSCSAPAQRLVATPWGPRMTPALYPVNAARYYNATLHQRYNATLHNTNARHTAPVWRPTCSTERRRRLQSAVPAGATNAHKLHYTSA